MAATSPNELLSEVNCFACSGSLSVAQLLSLALLIQQLLALDPNAIVTPEGLQEYGACWYCLGSISLYDVYELGLLDQISQLV